MTGFLGVIRHSWLCKERKTLCAEVSANLSEILKARHGGWCRTSQTWELEAGTSRVQVICPYIASSSLGCVKPWLGKTEMAKGEIEFYATELNFNSLWNEVVVTLNYKLITTVHHKCWTFTPFDLAISVPYRFLSQDGWGQYSPLFFFERPVYGYTTLNAPDLIWSQQPSRVRLVSTWTYDHIQMSLRSCTELNLFYYC